MRGIGKSYGPVRANHDITLDLRVGEVLGLLGENGAGKSTLVKILFGTVQPDSGTIEVNGTRTRITDPSHALRLGIGMVHQHFTLVPTMTVAENVALALGRGMLRPSGLAAVARELRDLAAAYGLTVDPEALVGDLSVGEKQRVEILKVLHRGADILILDEPTAVLTPGEWTQLRAVIRTLTAQGTCVVLITHKLEEICQAADRCVVLRDGTVVGEVAAADMESAALARLMVGRDVDLTSPLTPVEPGAVVLEVREVCLRAGDRTVLADVGMTVREGEVFGIAGVDGNGQRELLRVLTGRETPTSGSLTLAGERPKDWTPQTFVAAGGAVVPEERQRDGVALSLSVAENLAARRHREFARGGVLRRGALTEFARVLMARFGIRAPSADLPVGRLSGGNQQKVVLARELERAPKLVVLAQPTRGLDVGAIEFVYRTLDEHRRAGGATVLISTELTEVLTLSDRFAVLFEGRLSRTFAPGQIDTDEIGLLMSGGAHA